MKSQPIPAQWSTAIDRWAIALRAAGRTDQTIETRTEHLRRCARQTRTGTPTLLSRRRLTEWVGSKDWSPETRRSMYASLRGFFGWAVGIGLVDDNVSDCLPSTKPGVPCPRPAGEGTYRQALEEARGAADWRAHIVLRLAGEGGLRRGEIAGIAEVDLFEDLDGWSLLVHGKGQKDRLVPLTDGLATELRACLSKPGRCLLENEFTGQPITPRRVAEITGAYLPAGTGLHRLRHRFSAQINRQTKDLRSLQALLGHASLATTERYVPVDQSAMRLAVAAAS